MAKRKGIKNVGDVFESLEDLKARGERHVESIQDTGTKRILDHVSGIEVPGGAEESEATQPTSIYLMDELKYPRTHIRTRPQFQIPKSPSDEAGSYPVDIAVFESDRHDIDNLRMIIECKAPDLQSGKIQLEKYLGLCSAKIGVWTNGKDLLVVKKIVKGNSLSYQDLPYIPRFEQDIDGNLELFKGKLEEGKDLKPILGRIRNYLAAREEGITHDAKFAEEIINLILCKIYDERETDIDKPLSFSVGLNDDPAKAKKRIEILFDKVKQAYPDIFDAADRINLTEKSILYCVGQIQGYSLLNASRDVVGDAFELFVGPALRGANGQYFTPRNVTNFAVRALAPTPDKTIIDPACGSGGFLISALEFLWGQVKKDKTKKGWTEAQFEAKKIDVAAKALFGIDKDRFLTKVAKAYMAIMGDGKGGIFCEDTLKRNDNYQPKTLERFGGCKFDYVFANPPYGDEIKIKERSILSLYDLGHVYKDGAKTHKVADARRPQILFIEKILGFLKEGGRAAIVLPETLFSNQQDRYIMDYILSHAMVEGVVSLPAETFKPSTDVKTCVLMLKNEKPPKDYNIFMAVCRNIGHDMRAKQTGKDDLPSILDSLSSFRKTNSIRNSSESGFVVKFSKLTNSILTPHTYWYKSQHKSTLQSEITLGDLLNEGIIETYSGKGVEAKIYTSSGIPFVRTSDIRNFEIARKTGRYISSTDYQKIKTEFDVRHKDILFVRRGRTGTSKSNGLIGEVAFVMKHQTNITLQGAITGIRLAQQDNSYGLTPENLLFLLTDEHVKKQVKELCGTENALTGLTDETFPKIKIDLRTPRELSDIHDKMKALIDNKENIESLLKMLGR